MEIREGRELKIRQASQGTYREVQLALHRSPRPNGHAGRLGGEPTVDPLEIGDPERGREIHETGGGVIGRDSGHACSACHSLDGSVGAPPQEPSFQGIFERAGDRVPGLSAVEYLRQSIVDPPAYVVEGFSDEAMPKSFSLLFREEDIDNLLAFLLTQLRLIGVLYVGSPPN